MGDRDLQVVRKAKELVKHTYIITNNPRRYPKKYRYSLVPEMQKDSMKINKLLREANRTDIRERKKERMELQTNVIGICDDLLFEIELSCDLHIISKKSMEYWSKMVSDIKHMTIAWRTSDRKR